MLRQYRSDQEIGEQDSPLLRALLERHPEAHQKIGIGIKRFFRAAAIYGTDCFWLERDDGTRTDFSYQSCVDAKGKSLYQEFAEACKEAVQPELTAAKKKHFAQHGNADGVVRCEITGELIAYSEAHLDHKKPLTFQVIVISFVTANNIEITPGILSRPSDAQFATTFLDKGIEESFRAFHRRIASLRIIKDKSNLRLGGSERITKSKRPVEL
jgi:hypothetical protein